METTSEAPGWYPDPSPGAPPGLHRYWTGRQWTQHVATQTHSPGAKTRSHRWVAGALIGLAVIVLVAVGGYVVTRSSKTYPKAWDPQVAPIADQIEELRDLSYEHPVPVRYLTDAQFRKRVGVESSKLTPEARRTVRDLAGTLRALGLIDTQTDLVKSLNTVNQAGVLAYYDPDVEEVVVRGVGPLDISRKATLAHELTHVLQDQHFDLQSMRNDAENSNVGSIGALTALIEGDAERIKFDYLRGLPAADHAAYDAAEAASGDSINEEIGDAAEIVRIELAAPYIFGPDVLRVLATQGGNDAVDDALRRDTPTDAIYLDPAVALREPHVVDVPAPTLDRGAKRLGDPDHLGAFDLLAVLASRLDRQVALDAADTWAGDSILTYRRDDRTCVRATIASSSTSGTGTLAGALEAWAATMPGATVTTDAAHLRSTLTSCDTGASRAPDAAKLEGALRLLAARNSLLGALLSQGFPVRAGACVSRGLVKTPLVVGTLDRDQALSAAEQQEAQQLTAALASQCRAAGET